jgi:hypothetical protein
VAERGPGFVGRLRDQRVDPSERAPFGAIRWTSQLDDRLAGGMCEGVDLDQVGVDALERIGGGEVVELSLLRYSGLGAAMVRS